MYEVSRFRLKLLRATYLLMVVGLGLTIWPLFFQSGDVEHMRGVVRAVLAGVSLMAIAGVLQPLKMLPLLLFELTWKTIWVAAFGLPLWLGHRLDADTAESMRACLMGLVIFPIAIPWRYVLEHYVRQGNRGRRAVEATLASATA
jgi:hypothetical protein